eukprot:6797912-Alexandrium_andersonii.AAC.1
MLHCWHAHSLSASFRAAGMVLRDACACTGLLVSIGCCRNHGGGSAPAAHTVLAASLRCWMRGGVLDEP